MDLEFESKISFLVTFITTFCYTKQDVINFFKTLLFPHKTAYFSNNSHNAYKNADGNSKINITNKTPENRLFENNWE